MRHIYLLASTILLATACSKEQPAPAPAPPPAAAPAPAPPPAPPLSPQDRAAIAAAAFKAGLMSELSKAVAEKGAAGAIGACGLAALKAKDAVSAPDLSIGRTSKKLRNPKNTAPEWVALAMEQIEKQPPAERKPVQFPIPNSANTLAYAEPLVIAPLCTQCHGAALKDDVKAALAAAYPNDQATGYKEGDLRGVLWIEVKAK